MIPGTSSNDCIIQDLKIMISAGWNMSKIAGVTELSIPIYYKSSQHLTNAIEQIYDTKYNKCLFISKITEDNLPAIKIMTNTSLNTFNINIFSQYTQVENIYIKTRKENISEIIFNY